MRKNFPQTAQIPSVFWGNSGCSQVPARTGKDIGDFLLRATAQQGDFNILSSNGGQAVVIGRAAIACLTGAICLGERRHADHVSFR